MNEELNILLIRKYNLVNNHNNLLNQIVEVERRIKDLKNRIDPDGSAEPDFEKIGENERQEKKTNKKGKKDR